VSSLQNISGCVKLCIEIETSMR